MKLSALILFVAAMAISASEPQRVYSPDPDDPWNRIFTSLFSRTFQVRLSDEFPEASPFRNLERVGGFPKVRISERLFERVENGDRAIDPLYPQFITSAGPLQVLSDPLYSELTGALAAAMNETRARIPVARAMMQSDVWAAYDLLFNGPLANSSMPAVLLNGRLADGSTTGNHRDVLLSLLRQFLKKLALSSDEIRTLPSNYAALVRSLHLPDLFNPDSGWIEVQWVPDRSHDFAVQYRRAARVFLKPTLTPADRDAFLDGLRREPMAEEKLEAVVLVVQNLIIDTTGNVVPSPLTQDVQLRRFFRDGNGAITHTEVGQYELSRAMLLNDSASGGFIAFDSSSSSYLPAAGNDYGFATPIHLKDDAPMPITTLLHTRCESCHGRNVRAMFTFLVHHPGPILPVIALNPTANEHAAYVAEQKAKRDDFKSLR